MDTNNLKSTSLKIVHVTSSYHGGAGRAAFRIHQALVNSGVNSRFMSLDTDAKITEGISSFTGHKISLQNKIWLKLVFLFERYTRLRLPLKTRALKQQLAQFNDSLDCEIASLPFSDYDLLQHPYIIDADIIHLHWVAGLLDYRSFFRANKKNVAWTVHDMNPIKGLFHYNNDEINNGPIAAKLDEKIKRIKYQAIKKRHSKLTIITPSLWLRGEVKKNISFRNVSVQCIPNPIDRNVFFPNRHSNYKSDYNIPEDNIVMLFVAQFITDKRKGIDLLIEALHLLKDCPVTLMVLGNAQDLKITGLNTRELGTVKNDSEMCKHYSNADAFIIPSREDNLPNVMLESFACGTPVIGFPVGGVQEYVKDQETGILAKSISGEALAAAIAKFYSVKDLFDRDTISNFAGAKFSEKLVAGEYIKMYTELSKTSS